MATPLRLIPVYSYHMSINAPLIGQTYRSYSIQRNGETFRKQYKVQIYKIKRTAKRKLSFDGEREGGG